MKKGQRKKLGGGKNKKKRGNNKSSGNNNGRTKLCFKHGDRVECFLGEAWETGTVLRLWNERTQGEIKFIMLESGEFVGIDHATKIRKSDSPPLEAKYPAGIRIECKLGSASEGKMWGEEWRPGVVVQADKDWVKNEGFPYLIKLDDEEGFRQFIGPEDMIRRAPLRFGVGDRVELTMMKDDGRSNERGTIVKLWPEYEDGDSTPYKIRLDTGQLIYWNYDNEHIVSSDIPSPVPVTSFSKGDRVECKVGGIWRQGTVMQSNLDWIERDYPPFVIRFDTGECIPVGGGVKIRACDSDAVVPISEALEKLGLNGSESLFETPPPVPECPICFLPLPIFDDAHKNQPCCGATVCHGCLYAHWITAEGEERTCAFCRATEDRSDKEIVRQMRNRAELNDAENIFALGCFYEEGLIGLPKDIQKAHELYVRAADLGSPRACYNAYIVFYDGEVFERDEAKAMHYLEKGAKLGEVNARHMLGRVAAEKNAWDLANRHWKISASSGHQPSLDCLKASYKLGMLSKDDLAECLRAHQKTLSKAWSENRAKAVADYDVDSGCYR